MNGSSLNVASTEAPTPQGSAAAGGMRPGRVRLGEELPVFCERCGYVLHGLPPVRCEHCEILYFRCPECGHSQPINTLRPAVQRTLGRLRAWCVGAWVFVKINIAFWLLFGWGAMGHEWSYHYAQTTQRVRMVSGPGRPVQTSIWYVPQPRPLDWESILAFGFFALPTGMVLRMLLLRWRRGYWVGLVVAALVVGAVSCGALLRQHAYEIGSLPGAFTTDLCRLMGLAACCVLLGSSVVFVIWSGLVRLFLPARVATVLLDWQQSPSDRVSELSRQ